MRPRVDMASTGEVGGRPRAQPRGASWTIPWPAVPALLALAVVAHASTYWALSDFDPRLFAYVGARWRQGAIPYRDLWDSKPPGIFALMALAPPAGGALGFAALEIAFAAAAGLLLVALLRRLGVERAWALFAAGCMLLLSGVSDYNSGGGQTESFLLAPEIATVYCWARGQGERRARWVALAGACAALATLFKLPGLAPLLAIGALMAVELLARRRTLRAAAVDGALLSAGFALPWLAVVGYFARHGAALDLLDASFVHPFVYGASNLSQAGGPVRLAVALHQSLGALLPTLAVALTGGSVALVRAVRGWRGEGATAEAPRPTSVFLVLLWGAAALCGALAGGRFYGHYFIACTASGSAALGVALHVLFRSAPSLAARAAIMAALTAPLGAGAAKEFLAALRTRHTPLTAQFVSESTVGEWLAAHGTPSDTLFVWDYAPRIYERAGLRNAFRFTTSVNLLDSPRRAPRFFREIRERWLAAPPTFVVLGQLVQYEQLGPYEAEVEALVAAGYAPAFRDGPYTVFRRQRAGPPPTASRAPGR